MNTIVTMLYRRYPRYNMAKSVALMVLASEGVEDEEIDLYISMHQLVQYQ